MHNIFNNSDAEETHNNSAQIAKEKEQNRDQQPLTLLELLENGDLDDEMQEIENEKPYKVQKTEQLQQNPFKQTSLLSSNQRNQFLQTFNYGEEAGLEDQYDALNNSKQLDIDGPQLLKSVSKAQPWFSKRISDFLSMAKRDSHHGQQVEPRFAMNNSLVPQLKIQISITTSSNEQQVEQFQNKRNLKALDKQPVQAQVDNGPLAIKKIISFGDRAQESSAATKRDQIISSAAIPNTEVKQEKRRGRKRERDDLYFSKAQERIVELRRILLTAKEDGFSVKERQRLRNQVSAQQSRIKRKEESMFLHGIVREKDEKFGQLFDILSKTLSQEQLQTINSKLLQSWCGMEEQTPSYIIPAPFGLHQPLTRQRSKQISHEEPPQETVQETFRKFDILKENFETKQEYLDRFKQNDEKLYSDGEK